MELSGNGWLLLCSVLLPELQTMPPGACMTPRILLMSLYLQLRSTENAESTGGRAGQTTGSVSVAAICGWVGAGSCEAARDPLQSTAFRKTRICLQMPEVYETAAA